MPIRDRVCPVCGTKFTPKCSRQVQCSAECSRIRKRERERRRTGGGEFEAPGVCENPGCRREYRRRSARQRYCSPECSRAAARADGAPRDPGLLYCIACERWLPVEEFPSERRPGHHKCVLCLEADAMPGDTPLPTRVCHHPGCNVRTANYYCDTHRREHFRCGADVQTYADGTAEVEVCTCP